jgi:AcrR family transcriptional regulator
MRADDVANPSRWSDLDARIDAVNDQMEEARKLARQRRKLLGKLRYIAKTITSAAGNDAPERWQALAAGVDELVQSGVPPSNREVRELLLPIVDDMPELTDPPQGFNLVLREIDRYLESRPPTLEVVLPPEPRAEVQEVARLLGGKSVVLIGGSRRPSSQETLKAAFGLNELLWIETREHQSLEGFEPYVARPDVAVVLLAIRWSSHSFGEVKQYCDRYGKPLVRLPGGYNVNQVARQLLSQCSDRLAPTS